MRRIILYIIFIISFIVGSILLWHHFDNQSNIYSAQSMEYKAVPLKSMIILRIPEVSDFYKKLEGSTPIKENFKKWIHSDLLLEDLKQLDGARNKESLSGIMKGKQIVISFNIEGKDNIESLTIFSICNKTEKKYLITLFKNYSKTKGKRIDKKTYDGVDIYSCNLKNRTYYFAEKKGLFLISRYHLLIENAIRQIDTEGLADQEDFKNLTSTVSNSCDINLFIQNNISSVLINNFFSWKFSSNASPFVNFSKWTELDLSFNDSEIQMGGFSISDNEGDKYIDLFKNQESGRFMMDKVLPYGTGLFVCLNLSDLNDFQKKYQNFLEKTNKKIYYHRKNLLNNLDNYSRKNFLSEFCKIAGKEFALIFGTALPGKPLSNRFFVAEVKNSSEAQGLFLPLLKRHAILNNSSLTQESILCKNPNGKNYYIYHFPESDFPELLFGKIFSAIASNYMCFYKNYIIFSNLEEDLKIYISEMEEGKTLSANHNFENFNSQMSSRSCFYSYINTFESYYLKDYYFSEKVTGETNGDKNSIDNFYSMGWQFIPNSGTCLNNAYLKYGNDNQKKASLIWKTELDSALENEPHFFHNHTITGNNEILVQDKKNNLYLIDQNGKKLWKENLPGKIIGKIHQIDIYGNKRFQYLFNTKDQICLIDRTGKTVSPFPIHLKYPATNEVSVFDYDHNRNFRIFVGDEKHNINVFDGIGNRLTGWKCRKTNMQVNYPIQYRKVGTMDYIFFHDSRNTYILDRKGEKRINTEPFAHSNNSLQFIPGKNPAIAITDIEGKIHLQYFNKEIKIIDFGMEFSPNHTFFVNPAKNGESTDYWIKDSNKLYIYNEKKELIKKTLPDYFDLKPEFVKDQIVTGLCPPDKKVYLFNSIGSVIPGFPINGDTTPGVGSFTEGSSWTNIIVGDGCTLSNYRIK